MFNCKFCQKEFISTNSVIGHQCRCSSNPNKIPQWNSGKQGLQTAWNKGLENYPGRPHTKETKDKLSKIAKSRGLGGHTSKTQLYFRKNDGTEVYLQSSYEINFATILEKLGIIWSRPNPLTWIDDDGIDHRYYPDFLIGHLYIDTKNDYLAIKDARKIELVKNQNNVDLRVVTKDNINEDFIKALLV